MLIRPARWESSDDRGSGSYRTSKPATKHQHVAKESNRFIPDPVHQMRTKQLVRSRCSGSPATASAPAAVGVSERWSSDFEGAQRQSELIVPSRFSRLRLLPSKTWDERATAELVEARQPSAQHNPPAKGRPRSKFCESKTRHVEESHVLRRAAQRQNARGWQSLNSDEWRLPLLPENLWTRCGEWPKRGKLSRPGGRGRTADVRFESGP